MEKRSIFYVIKDSGAQWVGKFVTLLKQPKIAVSKLLGQQLDQKCRGQATSPYLQYHQYQNIEKKIEETRIKQPIDFLESKDQSYQKLKKPDQESSIIIGVDLMGGKNAPMAPLEAVVSFCKKHPDVYFYLYGTQEAGRLAKKICQEVEKQVEFIETPHIVKDTDSPIFAFKNAPLSSIRIAIDDVHSGKIDGYVSGGNTGALMFTAKIVLKTLEGVKRPAIIGLFPTNDANCAVLDIGANNECTAEMLVQFGQMGACFFRSLFGKEQPNIMILNVGEEEIKGRQIEKSAAKILAEISNSQWDINSINVNNSNNEDKNNSNYQDNDKDGESAKCVTNNSHNGSSGLDIDSNACLRNSDLEANDSNCNECSGGSTEGINAVANKEQQAHINPPLSLEDVGKDLEDIPITEDSASDIKKCNQVCDGQIDSPNAHQTNELNEQYDEHSNVLKTRFRFCGFIESHDIFSGMADVIVTDGFTGNVLLKASEGTARVFLNALRELSQHNMFHKILLWLLQKPLKKSLAKFNPDIYNGAMLIGLNGIVVKSHGSATTIGFENALHNAYALISSQINDRIRLNLEQTSCVKSSNIHNVVDKIKGYFSGLRVFK